MSKTLDGMFYKRDRKPHVKPFDRFANMMKEKYGVTLVNHQRLRWGYQSKFTGEGDSWLWNCQCTWPDGKVRTVGSIVAIEKLLKTATDCILFDGAKFYLIKEDHGQGTDY
jgi:hypothetical protein